MRSKDEAALILQRIELSKHNLKLKFLVNDNTSWSPVLSGTGVAPRRGSINAIPRHLHSEWLCRTPHCQNQCNVVCVHSDPEILGRIPHYPHISHRFQCPAGLDTSSTMARKASISSSSSRKDPLPRVRPSPLAHSNAQSIYPDRLCTSCSGLLSLGAILYRQF